MKLLHRKVLSTIIAFAVAINYCTLTSFAKETDGNWVENKDNWRHGITEDSDDDGSDSGDGSPFEKGHASGEYAVEFSDGTYYWYHQVSGGDGCKYCGDWSSMNWGGGGSFGSDGCAIYSTAIIVSNLYGEAITPHKWLEDIGCKISGNNCDTGPSPCLSGHGLTAYSNILGYMKDKYHVEPCTDDLLGKSSEEQKKGVDETLEKGGLVWYRIANSYGSHYLVIRAKTSDGKYLLLDECVQPKNSNTPETWETVRGKLHGGPGVLQGFICTEPKTGSGASGSDKVTTDLGKKYQKQIKLLNGAKINKDQGKTAPIIGWDHPNWYAGILSDTDKQLIEKFAKEHFKDDMTPAEKACITWDWIHNNVRYPYDDFVSSCSNKTAVECIFRDKVGQCLQYNGAMEAMLLYLGFDAREVHGTRSQSSITPGNGHDHYWCEVKIGNKIYLIDTGNSGDSGDIALTHFCITYDEAYKIDVSNGFGYYQERGTVVKESNHTHSDWGSIK